MNIEKHALTFDDVLLLPDYSEILPKDVSLRTHLTRQIQLNIPVLSAAMDTVTEAPLAIALAELGGMGVLHKNMSIQAQADEVRKVKKFESGVVKDPITVSPDMTIGDLLRLRQEHHISGMPVVEANGLLVGIITNRDMRFETNLSRTVAEVMTPKERLITVPENVTREQALSLLHQHRIEKLPMVDNQMRLRGMITVKDILKAKENPLATKDADGRLRVAAAVGTAADTQERVTALVEAGVDLIVVDTAHGHSKGVLNVIQWIKSRFRDVQVMGGNIATADAAKALVKAGVDAVKVGMGPGSICITRIVAGIGVPQITAVYDVAQALKGKKIPVIADGGIRFSGDIAKAIAAGADAVMVGGLFAGAEEAPGEVVLFQGRSYKSYRGMGSIPSMAKGAHDRYFQDNQSEQGKFVPEGIEGRVPYKGPLRGVVHQLMGGLRSSMGYTGCPSIHEMQTKAKFVRITTSGMRESHAHNVTITKEAPNYSINE